MREQNYVDRAKLSPARTFKSMLSKRMTSSVPTSLTF